MRRQRRPVGSRRGCSYYYKCAADDENACSIKGSDGDYDDEDDEEDTMKVNGNVRASISVQHQSAGQTKKKNPAPDYKVWSTMNTKTKSRVQVARGRRHKIEEMDELHRTDGCRRHDRKRADSVLEEPSGSLTSPGWPLLRNARNRGGCEDGKAEAKDEEDMSVVEWAMRLPERPIREERVAEKQRAAAAAEEEEEEEEGQNYRYNRRSEEEAAGRIAKMRRIRRRRVGCGGVAIGRAVAEEEDEEEMGGGVEVRRRRRRRRRGSVEEEEVATEMAINIVKRKVKMMCRGTFCKEFRLLDIEVATQCFAQENMIGEGGCSRVYRGMLADGKMIAVKRLHCSSDSSSCFAAAAAAKSGGGGGGGGFVQTQLLHSEEALLTEIGMMSQLHHRRVAKLLGYCIDTHPPHHLLLLVYNLASGGNLDKCLHPSPARAPFPCPPHVQLGVMTTTTIMSWDARFRVAVGVAEALHYLHHLSSPPVIHRDIKPSNILLSSNHHLEPQLADFGLAIWAPSSSSHQQIPSSSSSSSISQVVGTFGYLAPEYLMFNSVSEKTDVYSFGVVLVELITGRKPIEVCLPTGEIVVSWARRHLAHVNDSNIAQLIDPKLAGAYDANQLRKLAIAASHCLRQSPRSRPPISWVLKLLMGEVDDDDHHDVKPWPEDSSHHEMATWSNDMDGEIMAVAMNDGNGSTMHRMAARGSSSSTASSAAVNDHGVNRKSADKEHKYMEESNELAERLSEWVLQM